MPWLRAYERPDSLTDEDMQRLNDVRREMWVNGAKGMVFGSVGGITGLSLFDMFEQKKKGRSLTLPPRFTYGRNNAFLAVMLGGVVGSYLSARLTGIRSVRDLYPVFERGISHPKPSEELDSIVERELDGHNDRVLQRRKTLSESLVQDSKSYQGRFC
uniref:Uncharacterized protein n=1 Tax=Leptocylindrus danicus TaxID=163516 RepID=A0A7S2KDW0_9STRA|mmetsp:Transcript_21748/g.32493  ORF Transcript_21748/g.32493 Transcript_21748/m.32493 type:complete len:158 (+) Transcript_21748:76-549(+)|eukprot:CAMPEP_0116029484 /NCGR_PEP_ID=MMETSP0321-20121206/16168_1 /TAXON_ID=163516 /ORGANISM="Leptocylindrus danicus var. danicus, Strain B650" /LENGTH=157 /DNA_ID=CAMNT_0003503871 /DNA_START=5 /DNA_END=478 /DNA_ORIENTATION=+